MAKMRYSKDQLENIERYQELINLLREQNALINEMNRVVAERIDLFTGKMKLYPHSNGRRHKCPHKEAM